jgi:DNA-directed RNA polymerase subunit K/omega
MAALKYKTNNVEDVGKTLESLNKEKISKPIMTKYEFDKIIGLRTMQLSSGAVAFVNVDNLHVKSNMELRQIAIQELLQGRLPYIVERTLSNNKKEHIRVRDLDLVAVKDRIR